MVKSKAISPVAIRVYVSLFAVGVGVAVTLLLIVPILKMNCVLFTRRCSSIEYQICPNNMLLIRDGRSGFSYWYDGKDYIFSYGDNLTGVCPTATSVGVTSETPQPIGDPIPANEACRTYSNTGKCIEYYSDPTCKVTDVDTGECITYNPAPAKDAVYTPTAIPGEKLGTGAKDLFIPVFALDARTMKLEASPICSRPLSQLPTELLESPIHSFKFTNGNDKNLNIYQVFSLLEKHGIYKRPNKEIK